jgi:hypothetical protein
MMNGFLICDRSTGLPTGKARMACRFAIHGGHRA